MIADKLAGDIYIRSQNSANPLSGEMYRVAIEIDSREHGINVKLPGQIRPNPETGRVEATFADNPQLPFESLDLRFKGGARAPLATPPTCGTKTSEVSITPWSAPQSGPPAELVDSFEITEGPGGIPCATTEADRPFELDFLAGLKSTTAGSSSPFVMRLQRPDGHQEFDRLRIDLPPGATADISETARCSEQALAAVADPNLTGAEEAAAPKCPAASEVGKATVGAGAGSSPFYVQSGKAYLAGPYKGAPLSLAVIVPALAGPFDLGVELVRTALHVDPRTAEITVESDPFPTILGGVPLRLRDIRVKADKPNFMQAGTNCDPMQITGRASGVNGATANLASRYQLGDCASLGFSPDLDLSFGKSKKFTKRNQHPPLNAKLSFNEGDANISYVEVALPQGVFLDQARLGRICSRANYAAESCPEESRVGYAKATTPLLADPVEGPVYLKASDNPLPDLAADLNGEIDIDLFGKIDQKENKRGINQIRNTFDVVPDVPVSDFQLTLDGGADGLLVNSGNICKTKRAQRVSIDMQAHNEMSLSERPLIGSACKQINKKKAKKLKKKAKKLKKKAKQTRKKARKASGKKANKLLRKSKKLNKKAKQAKRQARKLGR